MGRARIVALKDRFTARGLPELCMAWDELVMLYTKASITFPQDRPIAIAGLARTFCGFLGYDQETISLDTGDRSSQWTFFGFVRSRHQGGFQEFLPGRDCQ
jgi:hypothetical protein